MRKIVFIGLFFLVFTSCSKDEELEGLETGKSALYTKAIALFQPLSSVKYEHIKPEMATLGKYLYFDTRLSNKGNVSCNSCHNLETFGVDHLATSPGDDGIRGTRNSPTVLHAYLHGMQFWDGRAQDVEEQAGAPILNPVEHNIKSEAALVVRIEKIKFYKKWFSEVFSDEESPITFKNIRVAIAAFERTLNPESKFDKYLEGDEMVLNDQEKRGLDVFITTGCVTCHNGVSVGGQLLQKFGVFTDYWALTKSEHIDNGLFDLTQKETDRQVFKVSGLRNVAHTYPYFHDGSVASLQAAVQIMGKAQNNIDLTENQVDDIVAFLGVLSADLSDEIKKSPFR